MTPRVGVVGCGRWGANVVGDLVRFGADVIVAERDAGRRERARVIGATVGAASAEQLPNCDGYVVVTPASSHREVCEHLLGRGVPVFVEKPPCAKVADVEALVTMGRDRLFVMHKWRYHAGVRALAHLATSGRLGVLQRLETTRTGPEPLPSDVDVLWHLGTHDLSIAVEILGAVAPPHEVLATRDPTGRLTVCRATMARFRGPEHRMTVAAGVPDRVRRIIVSGTEGFAILDRPDAPAVSVHTDHGIEEVAILAEELRVFLAHLDGGPPPVSDASTALGIAQLLSELQQLADEQAA